MPKLDNSIMISRDKIISEVKKIVNPDNVLSHIDEIKPYETDALAAYKQIPLLVVLPETVKEVSNVLKYCNENKIKVVPRGAGTGLSGGSLPLKDCILLAMGKFNKIIELDYENRCVVTQPCVTNLAIRKYVSCSDPSVLVYLDPNLSVENDVCPTRSWQASLERVSKH